MFASIRMSSLIGQKPQVRERKRTRNKSLVDGPGLFGIAPKSDQREIGLDPEGLNDVKRVNVMFPKRTKVGCWSLSPLIQENTTTYMPGWISETRILGYSRTSLRRADENARRAALLAQ